MKSVVVGILGAIIGASLKSLDCGPDDWEWWAVMVSAAFLYLIGALWH